MNIKFILANLCLFLLLIISVFFSYKYTISQENNLFYSETSSRIQNFYDRMSVSSSISESLKNFIESKDELKFSEREFSLFSEGIVKKNKFINGVIFYQYIENNQRINFENKLKLDNLGSDILDGGIDNKPMIRSSNSDYYLPITAVNSSQIKDTYFGWNLLSDKEKNKIISRVINENKEDTSDIYLLDTGHVALDFIIPVNTKYNSNKLFGLITVTIDIPYLFSDSQSSYSIETLLSVKFKNENKIKTIFRIPDEEVNNKPSITNLTIDRVLEKFGQVFYLSFNRKVTFERINLTVMILTLIGWIFLYGLSIYLYFTYKKLIKSNTIIKEKNIKLKESVLKEKILEEQKINFMLMATHELRTPLNGIKGNIELLLDEKLIEKSRDKYFQIYLLTNNLIEITNKVILYNKIKDIKLYEDVSNVFFIFEKFKKETQDILRFEELSYPDVKRNIHIECNTKGDLNVYVSIDEEKILTILKSSFNNALKFTQNGTILILFEHLILNNKSFLYIEMIDTGIGLEKENLQNLFKPFSQNDEGLIRKFGGTGLSSAINYELTSLMNGEISLKNRMDNIDGCIFSLKIPLKIVKNKEINEKIIIHSKSIFNILIVEDNLVNQKVLKAFLNKLGFQNIDIANNGSVGLDLFKHSKYQCIFMDIQMPIMDGTESTRLIREYENYEKINHCKIFAVTAHAQEGYFEEIKNYGFDFLISKPISINIIDETINKYFRFEV